MFTFLKTSPLYAAMLIACISIFITPDAAMAAGAGSPPPGICTTDPTYNIPNDMTIITTIVDNITCILYGKSANPRCSAGGSVSSNMFNNLISNGTFATVLRATASLFVIIFALSFMLGIVQLTLIEFTMRAFKLSLIVLFLSPTAWNFFYNIVGVFFQNGTNWLISVSTQIALGTIPGLDPSKPFLLIDYSIATAFSAKMFVTMIAMFFTGPYGWLFGILVLMGLGSFVAALFQGVWIYLMSMVIRAFLFGLAPIFFPFILFSKTRHLFDGWLQQLVHSMLQPTLLFTFFAFFSVLVQSAMNNILRVPVCYMPGSSLFAGGPNDEVLPRFTINGQPYGREWNFMGPTEFPGFGPFPIDIMDVLIFLLLTQLAWRFNGISVNVAKELSGASTSMNIPGAFSNMLSPSKNATNAALQESNNAMQQYKHTAEFNRAKVAMDGGGGGSTTPAGSPDLAGNRRAPGSGPPKNMA